MKRNMPMIPQDSDGARLGCDRLPPERAECVCGRVTGHDAF